MPARNSIVFTAWPHSRLEYLSCRLVFWMAPVVFYNLKICDVGLMNVVHLFIAQYKYAQYTLCIV